MIQSDPSRFYLDGDYERFNPSWDTDDSTWKATLVANLLARHQLCPRTLAEIGCGAGAVLSALQERLPDTELHGWDIAPGASRFWGARNRIKFTCGDFLALASGHFDVLLLLDVIEHVANPHDFLSRLAPFGTHFVLHIPLDLSAASVLRETPLLRQRRSVGHIHYFTRNLALDLLSECGYDVVEASFSGAHLQSQSTWRGKLAGLVRRAVFACHREAGVRLLGGDTLLVLAVPRAGVKGARDVEPAGAAG
jgi:SAM-dependent methyltransferase